MGRLSEEETWMKIKTDRDSHTLRRTVSKNHRTTAAHVAAELNTHLEDSVSTKSD
jgi:hypothetical protein